VCLVALATAAVPTAAYLIWTVGDVGYRTAGLATLTAAVAGLAAAVVMAVQPSSR
jgi:hypothetical protein